MVQWPWPVIEHINYYLIIETKNHGSEVGSCIVMGNTRHFHVDAMLITIYSSIGSIDYLYQGLSEVSITCMIIPQGLTAALLNYTACMCMHCMNKHGVVV